MNYKFDFNEWYTLIASIILTALFLIIRKHFRPIVILMIWVFNVSLVASIDYALASTPFKTYYCLDNETYEPMGAVAHVFLYTPFSFFFLYFYDKWSIRGKRVIPYLVCWTCFSVFFEWLNIQFGFITYTAWGIWYSIVPYPLASLILIKVYRFVEAHLPKRSRL